MNFPVAFALTICSLETVAVAWVLWYVWRRRNDNKESQP